MSAAELLEQLRAPERWTRDQARRLLYALPKADAIAAADAFVAKLAEATPLNEKLLYEVTGVYCAHEEPRPALVERFCQSRGDFRVPCVGRADDRRVAARVAEGAGLAAPRGRRRASARADGSVRRGQLRRHVRAQR